MRSSAVTKKLENDFSLSLYTLVPFILARIKKAIKSAIYLMEISAVFQGEFKCDRTTLGHGSLG